MEVEIILLQLGAIGIKAVWMEITSHAWVFLFTRDAVINKLFTVEYLCKQITAVRKN